MLYDVNKGSDDVSNDINEFLKDKREELKSQHGIIEKRKDNHKKVTREFYNLVKKWLKSAESEGLIEIQENETPFLKGGLTELELIADEQKISISPEKTDYYNDALIRFSIIPVRKIGEKGIIIYFEKGEWFMENKTAKDPFATDEKISESSFCQIIKEQLK